MKIASIMSLCFMAGISAFALEDTNATSSTTIKEMQNAPNISDRSVRTSGRAKDANTGMAAPVTGSEAGIRHMNDNMADHTPAWRRQQDKMKNARNHRRPTNKVTRDRDNYGYGTGITGATVAPANTKVKTTTQTTTNAEAPNSYGAAGTPTGNDRNLTAGDQSKNQKDLEITRQIRQGLMAQKDLSTRAHNLTVVSENGVVTLRGTVPNDSEKTSAEQIARGVTGVASITNLIQVSK